MTTAIASWNFSRKRTSSMQVSSGRPHMHTSNQRGRGYEPVIVLGKVRLAVAVNMAKTSGAGFYIVSLRPSRRKIVLQQHKRKQSIHVSHGKSQRISRTSARVSLVALGPAVRTGNPVTGS